MQQTTFRFPEQWHPHQATWLQWPHPHQYGKDHPYTLDPIFQDIIKELSSCQQVNIIVYDHQERARVQELNYQIPNLNYFVYPTDDIWVRDNGPIFVKDQTGKIYVEHWGFNAWGGKARYNSCCRIPEKIAKDLGLPLIDLTKTMVNEGGSVEIGQGVLMGCKSSIINKNRNPNMTQEQAEQIFRKYYGVNKFIWLEGVKGRDITDMHVDGFARFGPDNLLITMSKSDLEYWEVPKNDINKIYQATNSQGHPYEIVELPLTKKDVKSSKGKNLGKASYVNYYIANNKVLVPNYDDDNDLLANDIIQELFPERKVVGIWVNDLFGQGGMIHCVTQQQPK